MINEGHKEFESSITAYNYYATKVKETSNRAELLLRKYNIGDTGPNFPFNLVEIKNPHKIYYPQRIKPVLHSAEKEFEKPPMPMYERLQSNRAKVKAEVEAKAVFRRMRKRRENKKLREFNKGSNNVKRGIQLQRRENKKSKNLGRPLKEKLKYFMREYHTKYKDSFKKKEEELDKQRPEDNQSIESEHRETLSEKMRQKEELLWLLASEYYLKNKMFGFCMEKPLRQQTEEESSEETESVSKGNDLVVPPIKLSSLLVSEEAQSKNTLSRIPSITSRTIQERFKSLNTDSRSKQMRTFNFEISKQTTPERGRSKDVGSKRSLEYEYSHEDFSNLGLVTQQSDTILINDGQQNIK